MNIGLLAFSLLGFALPLYLYILQRKMGRKAAEAEELRTQEEKVNGKTPTQVDGSDESSDEEEENVLVSRGALVF